MCVALALSYPRGPSLRIDFSLNEMVSITSSFNDKMGTGKKLSRKKTRISKHNLTNEPSGDLFT